MGALSSSLNQDLSQNDLLLKFVGKDHIPLQDAFWNDLLSFPYKPLTVEDDKKLFEKNKFLFNHLAINNLKTGNFGTLLRIFLKKSSYLLQSSNNAVTKYSLQTYNALLVTRYYLQHLVHKFPECEVIKHIENRGSMSRDAFKAESLVVQLINGLMNILIALPIFHDTNPVRRESINALLVLLSIELFTTESITELKLYNIIFGSSKSRDLGLALITTFSNQGKDLSAQGSSFFGLGDIVGLLLPATENEVPSLSRSAALLLIVLVNQYIASANPYRNVLSSISDFSKLYHNICIALEYEETTLLLYHLLHRNEQFKTFVLSQSDIDILVVPMLRAIYHANDSSCHHMYMSLIILLILTEDVEFNKKVHEIVLKSVSWYVDRQLSEITLGGLIILVTTRTIQYNLLKMRDEYLHTNCLAALANMSSQFSNLNSYVCQRLVGLFEVLAKTYNRAKQEVLEYFISKLETEKDVCTDVDTVLKVIVDSSPKWPSHRLQKFPELKFKYVEEEKPEEFFIPYVWSLVSDYSSVYLQSSSFKKC
ncbi:dymeclin isoform X3 [Halyomorpha halys]|uniref:dymeclin isoform X3 n=1 Tax=Halyomorpha halys TaxID=286706 RepID=UPI0006D4F757|nr:dymeclin isoform X2 [Halyomorpha halys]